MAKWRYTYEWTGETETREEAIEEISADLMDEAQSPWVISNSLEEDTDG